MSLEGVIIVSSTITVLILVIVHLLMRNSQLKEKLNDQNFKQLEDKMNGRFDAFEKLSRAEFEAIRLWADGQGRTMKEIAAQLYKSENTIKKEIQNARNKLGVKTRSEIESLIRKVLNENKSSEK